MLRIRPQSKLAPRHAAASWARAGCRYENPLRASLVPLVAPNRISLRSGGSLSRSRASTTVERSVLVEIQPVGNHMHREGAKQTARPRLLRKPPAWCDHMELQSPVCPLLAMPVQPRQIAPCPGREYRARTAELAVPATPLVIVAAAGERPHIVQSPNQRETQVFERAHIEKAPGDPVQVHDRRSELTRPGADSVRQPAWIVDASGPVRVREHRNEVQRGAQSIEHFSYDAFGTNHRRLIAMLDLYQHSSIDTDAPQSLV